MIAILFNVLAIIVGSAIGAIAKRSISEKYTRNLKSYARVSKHQEKIYSIFTISVVFLA